MSSTLEEWLAAIRKRIRETFVKHSPRLIGVYKGYEIYDVYNSWVEIKVPPYSPEVFIGASASELGDDEKVLEILRIKVDEAYAAAETSKEPQVISGPTPTKKRRKRSSDSDE